MGVSGAAHTAMAALSNRRLRHMAEIDEKLAELEGFSDYIREYQEATAEDDEDDADYLMNLERERQEREHEGLKGTLWEPSLVICWLVIAFVTLYVVIAIITGHPESAFKDEL